MLAAAAHAAPRAAACPPSTSYGRAAEGGARLAGAWAARPRPGAARSARTISVAFAVSAPPETDPRAPQPAYVTAPAPPPLEAELLRPLPPLENAADDPALHNPLLRAERLGTGWFGVVVELEGVLVPSTAEAHAAAWLAVAAEMGLPRPLGQSLTRTAGVRSEVRPRPALTPSLARLRALGAAHRGRAARHAPRLRGGRGRGARGACGWRQRRTRAAPARADPPPPPPLPPLPANNRWS